MNVDECPDCGDTGVTTRFSGLELWCARCPAGRAGAEAEREVTWLKPCAPVPCPSFDGPAALTQLRAEGVGPQEALERFTEAALLPDLSINRGGIRWPVPDDANERIWRWPGAPVRWSDWRRRLSIRYWWRPWRWTIWTVSGRTWTRRGAARVQRRSRTDWEKRFEGVRVYRPDWREAAWAHRGSFETIETAVEAEQRAAYLHGLYEWSFHDTEELPTDPSYLTPNGARERNGYLRELHRGLFPGACENAGGSIDCELLDEGDVFPAGCVCHLADDVDRGEVFVPPREGCPVHTPWAFPGYSLGTLDAGDRYGVPNYWVGPTDAELADLIGAMRGTRVTTSMIGGSVRITPLDPVTGEPDSDRSVSLRLPQSGWTPNGYWP